jgi:predicted nucleotidyltransferase
MSERRKLKIDWIALETAFTEGEFGEFAHADYFDLKTGQVVHLDDDVDQALDQIEEELRDGLPDEAEVTAEMVRGTDAFRSLPDWQKAGVLAAAEFRFGDADRFEAIPRFESHESYAYMEDFIDTARDPAVQQRLRRAIGERKPFRRFREAMAGDRRLERAWNSYEHRRRRETIIQWLDSIGVEPANPDDRTFDPPPLPELRTIMFAEVRRFVRLARELPGVLRIALVGSLATDKEFPKDIDLLVTVSDDCDLAPLAQLGRQLSGHMTAHQAGADVFLADPDGKYLGRTCPWRECGPGLRVSCDARHCGARHYLHDDWDSVRLSDKLIANPPVVLWPRTAAVDSVPPDVRAELIDQL